MESVDNCVDYNNMLLKLELEKSINNILDKINFKSLIFFLKNININDKIIKKVINNLKINICEKLYKQLELKFNDDKLLNYIQVHFQTKIYLDISTKLNNIKSLYQTSDEKETFILEEILKTVDNINNKFN